MARFQVQIGTLPKDLGAFISSLERFPADRTNPLIFWRTQFGARTLRATRPSIDAAGTFRGNYWPPLEPAYTRGGTPQHPQVEQVPVWGGVERWRAGSVTRSSGGGQRYLKYMTPSQVGGASSDVGVIRTGQTFTGGTVLAKLRSGRSGERYQRGDAQLGKDAQTGLLGDFALSDPILNNNNRSVTVTTNRPHAGAVHDRRPFATGPEIDREEEADVLRNVTVYVDTLLKRLDGGR